MFVRITLAIMFRSQDWLSSPDSEIDVYVYRVWRDIPVTDVVVDSVESLEPNKAIGPATSFAHTHRR